MYISTHFYVIRYPYLILYTRDPSGVNFLKSDKVTNEEVLERREENRTLLNNILHRNLKK